MNSQVKLHTAKDAVWTNAAGDQVPVKFVPKSDRVKESLAITLHKEALKVEAALKGLHSIMDEACAKVGQMVREEYELKNGKKPKPTKGNMTWYSFDNSIKVEANVNEVVKWNDAMMHEAKGLLNEYLDSQLTDNQALIKKLVNDAFSNTKGAIDSRKVFQLLRYESQINSSKFRKACEIMREAQMIDRTKLYMCISERLEDGSYRQINLNFSSL